MKKDLISTLRNSFNEMELIDLAARPRGKVMLDKNSKELLNRYILEFKSKKISRDVFIHRYSVLTGSTSKEAIKYSDCLANENVVAFYEW